MGDETAKPRLGRGLAALIGEVGEELAGTGLERSRPQSQRRVPIEFLRPNPRNPRKSFETNELEQLAESIRQRGIIQPIVVRAIPNLPDAYEIVAGERRWRAAQRAGLHEAPIVLVDIDDKTSLEFAIIENVQRADLNAIDEAAGYDRLVKEFQYSANDLAQVLGKSRSYVVNAIRLLNLPQSLQELVVKGDLSAGHARALLAVKDPEAIAKRVLSDHLTVRDLERIAQEEQQDKTGGKQPRKDRVAKQEKDPDTRAVEKALEDVLGLQVSIDHKGDGGELRIRYSSIDQLDSLCRRLHDSSVG